MKAILQSVSRCHHQKRMFLAVSHPCYCSVTQFCLTLCNPMDCSPLGFPFPSLSPRVCSNSCPLNWWCHSTILSSVVPFCSYLQSFPASVFSIESAFRIRGIFGVSASVLQYQYWSFSFSISPSNEYSGLISFRIDCFDLLSVQGTLKSLLSSYPRAFIQSAMTTQTKGQITNIDLALIAVFLTFLHFTLQQKHILLYNAEGIYTQNLKFHKMIPNYFQCTLPFSFMLFLFLSFFVLKLLWLPKWCCCCCCCCC